MSLSASFLPMSFAPLFASFVLVTVAELGDKTQFAVIALSAEYEVSLLVYFGVIMAFATVTGVGVTVGKALTRFVPLKYIQLGSEIVFILFGVTFLVNALLGYTPFL